MARVVAEKLSGALNRAGGSGLVGTRSFIKNAPDGYTIPLRSMTGKIDAKDTRAGETVFASRYLPTAPAPR